MSVLTVNQPWAHAILHSGKMIENRSWSTAYRGPLLIHASTSVEDLDVRFFPDGARVPSAASLTLGAILGQVELVDCLPRKMLVGNIWAEGPICWILTNPRPLVRPICVKGQLRLWNLPAAIEAAVLEQLEG